MTSVFVSFVVLLAFCLTSDALTVRSNTFSEDDAIKDDVIFHDELLFESPARSHMDCALRCSEQDDCRLFTWVNSSPGGSSARCRGHSSCCPNQTNSTSVAGAKAYRLEGKECTSATTSWLNKNCTADCQCPAAHSECFKGQCLCTPGYYYSISQNSCTANCSNNQLQSSFLRYAGTDIPGCTAFSSYPPTLDQCLEKCLSLPYCRSVDFGNGCCGHTGTTSVKRDVNEFDLYQRKCE